MSKLQGNGAQIWMDLFVRHGLIEHLDQLNGKQKKAKDPARREKDILRKPNKPKASNPQRELEKNHAVDNLIERRNVSKNVIRNHIRRSSRRLEQGLSTEIHQTQPAPREIQQNSFLSVDYYNTGVRGPMKSERALSTSNLAKTMVLLRPSLREPQAEDTGSGFGDPQRARDGTSNTPFNVLDIPGQFYKAPKISSVGIIAKEIPKGTSRVSEENFEPKL